MNQCFFDIKAARKFIEQAVKHYEVRLGESWRNIVLDELATLSRLYEEGQWIHETLAVNMTYKLFDRVGRDTSGIIGY